ncbi:hypothetical protein [Haloarchaeobius iranensis]|uniref:Uncharacterized protein n=1 Tax=Haloarchaeobius iranensis TaxID=996166 RepID=A0A1G9SGM9_9EURY|nr:hypothetical protein [Haloarchaeobius iranensis]SDM34551.1 hypothetical protein SAMN05192554_101174 [Haloarchaeobius iranensis]
MSPFRDGPDQYPIDLDEAETALAVLDPAARELLAVDDGSAPQ